MNELTISFVTEFEHYLRSTRIGDKGRTNKCDNNSAVKYVRNFRKVIKQAVDHGWLQFDLFTSSKGKVRAGNPTFLTPEEISKIENKKILNPRLCLIRGTHTIY